MYDASFFRREMIGMLPPQGIYTHVVGTDLIRDKDGTLLVLEDNARNPSGVSYVLECREVILPNVKTYIASRESERKHILEHLHELVVKQTDASGGYGMLIGSHSTEAEREDFKRRIIANPRSYIAQPTISLGRHPTIVDGQLEGRCVDLRPYILHGDEIRVIPGGLARVALRRGSLVVNSSQVGGYKDTWVLAGEMGPGPALPAAGDA